MCVSKSSLHCVTITVRKFESHVYSFGSLHQKDQAGRRTEEEAASFGAALQTMGVWYAHRLLTTYIMSELPPGYPKSPEVQHLFPKDWLRGKGWPTFERTVSQMIKVGNRLSGKFILMSRLSQHSKLTQEDTLRKYNGLQNAAS